MMGKDEVCVAHTGLLYTDSRDSRKIYIYRVFMFRVKIWVQEQRTKKTVYERIVLSIGTE